VASCALAPMAAVTLWADFRSGLDRAGCYPFGLSPVACSRGAIPDVVRNSLASCLSAGQLAVSSLPGLRNRGVQS
jgi:hypothetical protein